jgi:protein-tyrosine phosphatase
MIADWLSDVSRWLGRRWERLTHPWRRRRLLASLARHRMPRGVLFVCHGNICRSPYAAAALRSRLGEAAAVIRVESAGFVGPIRGAPRMAKEVAAERGLDLSDHRSRTLSPMALNAADIVAVMEPEQVEALRRLFPTTASIIVLGDLDPQPDGGRAILDPLDRPREIFAQSYDRIDSCVAVLADAIAG